MFPYCDGCLPSNDAPALFCAASGRWWSHAELAAAVADFTKAVELSTRGLVFHFIRNQAEHAVAYLGMLEAGHAVALFDPALDAASAASLIGRYRPEWIVAPETDRFAGLLKADYQARGVGQRKIGLWRAQRVTVQDRLHPQLSVLLSTSGSTGSPKLVRLSRDNLAANAEAIIKALDLGSADRAVGHLAFHYSFGLSVLHSHLRAGGSLVLLESAMTDAEFWKVVREQQCTFFYGVPFHYEMLRRLNFDRLKIPSIRKCAQAGGKAPDAIVKHFHEALAARGGTFYVMYGQTEASPRIATLPPSALPEKIGSAGCPLDGGQVEIIDAEGRVMPPGVQGEIVYHGPNVMLGYAESRDDLSRGDVLGQRLATGDLGYLDSDGCLFITGRAKRIAKVFGLRINLDEVEQLASPHARIAAVEGQDQLILFLEQADADRAEVVRGHLLEKISVQPGAMKIRTVPNLPLRANGKLDHQRLKDLL